MSKFQTLLDALQIKFANMSLLQQAFTHRSYLNEVKAALESNERLEFLGDAILSFLVSQYLYSRYPQHPEGILTSMRSNVVKTETLASIAKGLNFGEYLCLSKGEEKGGGRQNASLLADTFEAFIGAVYLDQDLAHVRQFLQKQLFVQIEKILQKEQHSDYKSRLQEIVQETSKISPSYKVIKTLGPDHDKKFWVQVIINGKEDEVGQGKSKQEAEQMAAYHALEKMARL